jgi:hypothetical protein
MRSLFSVYEGSGLDYYAQTEQGTPIDERRLICDDAFRDVGLERKKEEYVNPYQVMYRWI